MASPRAVSMAEEVMKRMTGSKRSLDRHDKIGRRQGVILVYFCVYSYLLKEVM